jgi:hypothetical protein
MSGASGVYPQKTKRKRYSTESGVMNHVLIVGTLGPMAQEAGRGDEGAGVYNDDIYAMMMIAARRRRRRRGL